MRLSQLIMAAAVVVLSVSCNDDFSSVGGNVLPGDEVISTHVETNTLQALSEMSDPIKSSNPTSFILGELQDEYFGASKADFITQFSVGTIDGTRDTTSLKAADNYELDSTRLLLKYPLNSWTGDTLANHIVSIYELTNSLSPSSSYNSDTKGADLSDPEVVGTITFNVLNGKNDSIWSQASYVDTLSIPIDDAIGEKIFTVGVDTITNNTLFRDFFKGFYVTSELESDDPDAEGSLVKFNHRSTSQELVLYYKRYEIDATLGDTIGTTLFERKFPVNSESVKINSFVHSNSSVDQSDISKLFVQPMAGSMGNIKIDNAFKEAWGDSIENIDSDYHLGIAAVDINVFIDTTATNYRTYAPPQSLSIYRKNDKDELTTPTFYSDNGTLSSGIGSGLLSYDVNENDEVYPSHYKFSFTPGYFEELVAPSSYNIDLVDFEDIYIMPLSPESNFDRVILHNTEIISTTDTIPAPYIAIKYIKLK